MHVWEIDRSQNHGTATPPRAYSPGGGAVVTTLTETEQLAHIQPRLGAKGYERYHLQSGSTTGLRMKPLQEVGRRKAGLTGMQHLNWERRLRKLNPGPSRAVPGWHLGTMVLGPGPYGSDGHFCEDLPRKMVGVDFIQQSCRILRIQRIHRIQCQEAQFATSLTHAPGARKTVV